LYADLINYLAINLHPPLPDQILSLAPGSNAGPGEKFMEPFHDRFMITHVFLWPGRVWLKN
jgi:hypothetical protein